MKTHLDLFSGIGGARVRYNGRNERESGSAALTASRVAARPKESSDVTTVSPKQFINNGRRSDDPYLRS